MALSDVQAAFLEQIDIDESYRFAKELEQFKSNPALGYRTAGSQAEFDAGEHIRARMLEIGLTDVKKDAFTLDTWEFSHARLRVGLPGGARVFELGAYQTAFDTNGWQPFTMIFAGRGTAAELDQLDVAGKLVLIEINQRADWWIAYPAYQAHLRGAAAVIAVQSGGYAQAHPAALNAQNICGPADAPAFSMSRADAGLLEAVLGGFGGEAQVQFDACSTIGRGGVSYNITGCIEGKDRASYILLSAHYDSYFTGFQDDNAAVAMMLGIAAALIRSGCRPRHTLVFCAFAAEEWGVCDSKYDWSTGAYNQVFRVRPDWPGKIHAALNFELPACAHGRQAVIRGVYEWMPFLEAFAASFSAAFPGCANLFPAGIGAAAPVLTWSDDFSLAISGIPSLVNDFAEGSFMESHYHSQFDNDDAYDPAVYRFHHALYGALTLAFDARAVPPLDFSPRLAALRKTLDTQLCARVGVDVRPLLEAAADAEKRAQAAARAARGARSPKDARALSAGLLKAFRLCEDAFTRLDWHDAVIFPHEYAQTNLSFLLKARESLCAGDTAAACDALCAVDCNRYALAFDDKVCAHFTDYARQQPLDRLMWGAGRLPGDCRLFSTVRALKRPCSEADIAAALNAVERAYGEQRAALVRCIGEENAACRKLAELLKTLPGLERA
ncbi:M28 family peptidase [Anaerotruncus colihominis]|uniref:M28 family peptidase n=1 Tax=Anaerotruncus colihominis TaxID=169435 RepID=UPI003995019A